MSPARRGAAGFTLIEMLAVVVIVGILAAAARPLLTLTARRAQEAELRAALRQLRGALDAYKQASDGHLLDVTATASGYPASLRQLTDGVPLKKPSGKRQYFLRRLPRDPFAEPGAAPEAGWLTRGSDSPPERPAPGADVFDVMSSSSQRALDGSRYADW